MPLLLKSEAHIACESFLSSIYGDDLFRRWRELKKMMKFVTEREYVSWLVDIGLSYAAEGESREEEEEAPYYELVEGGEEGEVKPEVIEVAGASYMDATDDSHSAQLDYTGGSTESGQEHVMDGGQYTSGDTADTSHDEWYQMHAVTVSGAAHSTPTLSGAASAWPDADKRLSCPHCHYSTKNTNHLNIHVKAVHERVRPYQCPHCDMQCSQLQNLNRHMVRKHGYMGKYQCVSCHKGFMAPSALEKHRISHHELKPGAVDLTEDQDSTDEQKPDAEESTDEQKPHAQDPPTEQYKPAAQYSIERDPAPQD